MHRPGYHKNRLALMPLCSVDNCANKVVNVTNRLCNNHYNQTPKGRDLVLRRKYGIGLGEYENLLKMQKHKCGVCGASGSIGRGKKVTRLCVDHDHLTGAVRGLLCSKCNAAIGLLKDDSEIIKKAVKWVAMSEGDR